MGPPDSTDTYTHVYKHTHHGYIHKAAYTHAQMNTHNKIEDEHMYKIVKELVQI